MTWPPVSIIINTLDRAPHLRRVLASLGHLESPAFEVVVVNGPSTDDTEAVLAEFAGQIKVARCPEANLSRSRNLGIAAAAGDFVAFIDDDALPGTPEWLTGLTAGMRENPEVGAVGGAVLQGDTRRWEFEGGATSDYGLQVFVQSELDRLGVAIDGRRWVRGVHGSNCAFRRDLLLRIGGFDETFAYYLDETDVCLRIARSGHAVINDRQSFNRHYKAPSGRRRSPHDIDWNVIARSDTYYALKNAVDRLPRRLLKTIALAPRKHFFREINRGRREGAYGRLRWLRYLARWARGVTAGVWLGLVADRRTPLSPAPPPAFLPFPCARPSRRLRVGLLARVYPPHRQSGGIARYTQELAYGLHALGHEVHVFTESAAGDRREGVRLFVHGISPSPETIIPGMPMTDRNMRWGLAVTERVIELAREGTVLDIVESPNWNSEGAPLRRTGLVPLVVRIHSPLTQVAASERWPASADLQTSIDLERWLVANADGVTSSTAAVLDTVRDTMGLSPAHYARYARIPLGVPPGASAVAVPDCPPRLLFVGRLERRKGAHTLLAAVPRLLASRHDLVVDVVGDDTIRVPGEPTIRERFEREQRGSSWLRRCRFHGMIDEGALRDFYRSCTIFVAPSLYESFGLIYLEAMRYGKPVIGCRTGGVPEVVRDGENGLLVPPDDAGALHDAIVRLLEDADLRRSLGARARKVLDAEFSSRMMAERTAAFYERVLQEPRIPSGLSRFREEPIELSDPRRVRFSGTWEVRSGSEAEPHRWTATPGSALHLTVPAGRRVAFRFLGHPWSGVVSLAASGRREYLDLFRPSAQAGIRWEVTPTLPYDTDETTCTLALESEANPLAQGRELWLQRVALCQ